MKLSRPERNIIYKLQNGWSLLYSSDGPVLIQGVLSVPASISATSNLVARGLLDYIEKPVKQYKLTGKVTKMVTRK